MDVRKIFATFSLALGAFLLAAAWPSAASAGMIELSLGGSFSRSKYSEDSYDWTRRYGVSAGYHLTDYTEIEFAFQDVLDRTKITGYEDTTFHDTIYSLNWIQSFFDKNYFVQPYVKVGAGQLEREASGTMAGGISPPSKLGSLTAVLGGGFKFYLTRTFALRAELTSYLTGGALGTWKDNYNVTYGFSYLF